MRKIIIIFLVLFLASGCDENTEMLSCSSTTTQNGIVTKTNYNVEHLNDEVKRVTITYDYSTVEEEDIDGIGADTDGLTEDDYNNNDTNRDDNIDNNNNDNARNGNNTDNNNNDNVRNGNNTDNIINNNGVNNDSNNQRTRADDIIDGVVGDAVDTTIDGVRETILDIAGIKNTYENQLSAYDDIKGFSYKVDVDSNTEYKITYDIDMDKISDLDLARFDISRNLAGMQGNYEDLGYTCR